MINGKIHLKITYTPVKWNSISHLVDFDRKKCKNGKISFEILISYSLYCKQR